MPITYEVFDHTSTSGPHNPGTSKGFLNAIPVGNEPVFTDVINGGVGEIQLQIDQKPENVSNLAPFDLIRIINHDGTYEGLWRYEKASGDESQNTKYVMHLIPIGDELTHCDFNANYTPKIDSDGLSGQQPQLTSVAVAAAIPRTKHCYVGNNANNGNLYDMIFQKRSGKVIDAPNRAIDFGGPNWWWHFDGDGKVDVYGAASGTQTIQYVTDIIWEKPGEDAEAVINVQDVIAGSHNVQQVDPNTGLTFNASVPFYGHYEMTTGPYSTTAIGRRVGQPWRDSGVMSQFAADQLAQNIVLRHNSPRITRTIRVLPNAPRLSIGQQVNIVYPWGYTLSGMWVTNIRKYGSTNVFEYDLNSAIDFKERPFRARNAAVGIIQSGNGGFGGGVPTVTGGMALIAEGAVALSAVGVNGRTILSSTVPFTIDSTSGCYVLILATSNLVGTLVSPVGRVEVMLQAGVDTQEANVLINSGKQVVVLDGRGDNAAYMATSLLPLGAGSYVAYLASTDASPLGGGGSAVLSGYADIQIYAISGAQVG